MDIVLPLILRNLAHRSGARRVHLGLISILLTLSFILLREGRAIYQMVFPHSVGWNGVSASQFFSSGLDYLLMGLLLIGAGIYLVHKADALAERDTIAPLRDILECVQAAAAGDLTRIPPATSGEEARQLSLAVGRLIGVLARSENLVYHLASLVDTSGEAIISHTLEGTILSWNKGAQRIYGYSSDEVKGRSITLLAPGDMGAEIARKLESVRNGERIVPFECLHQARNGRTVKALVRLSPILDSRRRMIGISFCAQDLTDADLHKPAVRNSPSSITINPPAIS